MISTSSRLFLQSPPPSPVNMFTSGDTSVLSPPYVRFRQSGNFAAAATCASVETESTTSSRCAILPPASFYEILGIPMGSTSQEIKSAYRRLARVYHPDVAATDRKNSSADDFMKIRTAYCTLSDPEKRSDYDRGLFRRCRSVNMYPGGYVRTAPSSMSIFTGSTPRNWETDQCW